MLDHDQRKAVGETAGDMLRDLIGRDCSDTIIRVGTDHLLSFHRMKSRLTRKHEALSSVATRAR